ncbi:hypothetical protein LOK49_LG02G03132 [Camellia lanceoleosa]|uniref:Uncharacterized protein n=1 Tax=Camellia lanceoleosa TaxID=1840588 RepID=A0ACC0IHZ7_9ERIC|nr:hypothetical protein LOK49_LG02G03132 [Camellia lanceoleosa]
MDFNTHFTFMIDLEGSPHYTDGLAFFLAPGGSNISIGGGIGLPINLKTLKPTSPFVAVESDAFQNIKWDPVNISPATHVGININSIKSNATAVWYCNITHGIQNKAWISFDSNSKNLSVVFTGSINNTIVKRSVHFLVDLRDYLPEWVTFGFSASTGSSFSREK